MVALKDLSETMKDYYKIPNTMQYPSRLTWSYQTYTTALSQYNKPQLPPQDNVNIIPTHSELIPNDIKTKDSGFLKGLKPGDLQKNPVHFMITIGIKLCTAYSQMNPYHAIQLSEKILNHLEIIKVKKSYSSIFKFYVG